MKKINSNNKAFPVVGIGASAGGLEAICDFLKAMPTDKGLAFVVVVHLDPDHVSLLPELLQKHTSMKVMQIIDGVQIQVNTVYVIPPDKSLSILHGRLQLQKMELPRLTHLPIDSFFRSLAQDLHDKAIAIILSGTGSDGTQGIKEIKAEAGLVLVQDETTAKYDGMPRSAIATGLVDYILPPEAMPEKLMAYVRFPNSTKAFASCEEDATDIVLQKIYLLIRNQVGNDFSLYKKNTIYRRIERRMHLHQIETMQDYFIFLQSNEQEVMVLSQELLIGVTSFFRDPEAYNVLQQQILPQWLAQKPNNYTLRVWTAGCSTGEEAYSIAILLQECLDAMGRNLHIQIFGTDIDPSAIEVARRGIYPASIIADVSSERLNRFFTKQDGYFKVKKSIRETLVFAPQNITRDPPFTKLDLITCRNLLIYFSAELQHKILPIFHFSLNDDGILFLGPSETTGQSTQFFNSLNKKWKLFSRNKLFDRSLNNSLTGVQLTELPVKYVPARSVNLVQKAEELSVMQLVEAILRHSCTPPCVIINANKDIIYIHGKLGKYLELSEGRISVNIINLIQFGLKAELLTTIRKVVQNKKKIQLKGCSFLHQGQITEVDLTVSPLTEQSLTPELLMVTFEEVPPVQTDVSIIAPLSTTAKDIEILQRELNNTKENLQTTIEELETTIEELKSSNEELQSTNEELQSTNEELETSKEELQSLNEEATTINAELQCRIDDYQIINDDMKNLFDSTQLATIFLDTELKIRRFTPKAQQIINLVLTDIGRPVSHLTSCLPNTNLSALADHVLKTLEKHESEIYDEKGLCFLVRIMPYRTLNNVIDGVVLTFENISERKTVELALTVSEQRYKNLFNHCPIPIWVENFAAVAQHLADLRQQGVTDLHEYLQQKPQLLPKLMALMQVVQVNDAALVLFNSSDKTALALALPKIISQETFLSQVQAIWQQCDKLRLEYICQDYHGATLKFMADWSAFNNGRHTDYSNIIVVVNTNMN